MHVIQKVEILRVWYDTRYSE